MVRIKNKLTGYCFDFSNKEEAEAIIKTNRDNFEYVEVKEDKKDGNKTKNKNKKEDKTEE